MIVVLALEFGLCLKTVLVSLTSCLGLRIFLLL